MVGGSGSLDVDAVFLYACLSDDEDGNYLVDVPAFLNKYMVLLKRILCGD